MKIVLNLSKEEIFQNERQNDPRLNVGDNEGKVDNLLISSLVLFVLSPNTLFIAEGRQNKFRCN